MTQSTSDKPVWDRFTIQIPSTPEEARVFVRMLNSPEGQAYLHRAAESLVALRRAKKRRRFRVPLAPVVDPKQLPFLLTVPEVAALLRTSDDAIYSRVERGELTALEGLVREGTRIVFHRDRLLGWLERAGEPRKRGGRR